MSISPDEQALTSPALPEGFGDRYSVGVVRSAAVGSEVDRFENLVETAIADLQKALDEVGLPLDVVGLNGPAMSPGPRGLDPLDALEIALTEKLERQFNFLIVVTNAEMEATRLSFAVAYPSRLTNVAVVSARRLLPDYQGEDVSFQVGARRLVVVMVHSLGHILNLSHEDRQANFMYDFAAVDDLDAMSEFDGGQRRELLGNIPGEAHDETVRGSSPGFWWRNVRANIGVITGTLLRANPLRLMAKLPTMLTAALSVVVVLFFSAEIWDIADAVEIYQIAIFTLLALVVAWIVLYRTFGFRTMLDRKQLVSESTVVTQTATALAVGLTLIAVFVVFFVLTYLAAVTIFPRELMAEWASIETASDPIDHVKLGLFLAGMATLTGSLGGRGDSKRLVRTVLFLDEET